MNESSTENRVICVQSQTLLHCIIPELHSSEKFVLTHLSIRDFLDMKTKRSMFTWHVLEDVSCTGVRHGATRTELESNRERIKNVMSNNSIHCQMW